MHILEKYEKAVLEYLYPEVYGIGIHFGNRYEVGRKNSFQSSE